MERQNDERRLILQTRESELSEFNVDGKSKQWVLLPVTAQKILISARRVSELNFFEETILRLLCGSLYTADQLSDMLQLDPRLVEFILTQLKDKGILTKGGSVTTRGKTALDTPVSVEKLTGYIFYDELSQRYFSDTFVFDENLNHIDTAGQQTFQWFQTGSVGTANKVKGLLLRPSHVATERLISDSQSMNEVYSICRESRKRFSRFYNSPECKDRDSMEQMKKRYQMLVDLENVTLIQDSTEAFYVASMIYMPRDLSYDSSWRVWHPFMGGSYSPLRATLNAAKSRYPELGSLINKCMKAGEKDGELDRRDRRKKELAHAQIVMEEVFSVGIHLYPTVLEKLESAYVLYDKIHASETQGKNADIPKGEFINEIYNALEHAFNELRMRYQEDLYCHYLTSDSFQNRNLLSKIASNIGFQGTLGDRPLQSFFDNMTRNDFAYMDMDQPVLKVCVSTCLLIASQEPTHPLWDAAKQDPSLIAFFQELTRRRNENSHDVEIRKPLPTEELRKIYVRCLRCLSLLFPELTWNKESIQPRSAQTDRSDYEIRKARAQNRIETFFGDVSDKNPRLYEYLFRWELEYLQEDSSLILAATILLEKLYDILIERVIEDLGEEFPKVASLVREKNDNLFRLRVSMEAAGFVFDLADLPEGFTNVNPRKIQRGFVRPDNQVLSVRLYMLLFSHLYRKNNRLLEIAQVAPNLLMCTVWFNKQRGHGNHTLDLSLAELDKNKKEFAEILKAVVPIILRK